MTHPTWTISELAREFSVTPRTLRFYEDQGILAPRRQGRNRVYAARDRARLRLALRGKRLGLQLSEIVSLIDMYDGPGTTRAQLQQYLSVLQEHRQMLEQQRRDIDLTLADIDEQQARCEALMASHPAPPDTDAA
ncbi:MAG TPA: MerR family DNA-binding transcriptional regulator [Burkholderiaceae bacterium]|nr:MerR family DNA-binding transcriptional regulator [Burkholderiaceae bacterium]